MLELNEYTDYQCKVVAGHAFKALTKGGLIPEMFSRIVEGKI